MKSPIPLVALLLAPSIAAAQNRMPPDKLKVGDEAPNFKAKVLGEKSEVELKEALKQGKPIVLIFGSYS